MHVDVDRIRGEPTIESFLHPLQLLVMVEEAMALAFAPIYESHPGHHHRHEVVGRRFQGGGKHVVGDHHRGRLEAFGEVVVDAAVGGHDEAAHAAMEPKDVEVVLIQIFLPSHSHRNAANLAKERVHRMAGDGDGDGDGMLRPRAWRRNRRR